MQSLKSICCLFLLFVFLLPQDADAQRRRKRTKQRFKAGLILGLTSSQIDGDQYTGFDKWDPQFGLSGIAIINPQLLLAVDFLYLQKGSATETGVYRAIGNKDRLIDLTYMEVPMYLRYKFQDDPASMYLEGGIAFGRMIRSSVTEPRAPVDNFYFSELETQFKRNDLSILFGTGYDITENFGLKFRYLYALTKFYEGDIADEPRTLGSPYAINERREIEFLRNYQLSFLAYYIF